MHIIYIEFGISKSNQYKKVCNLAKQNSLLDNLDLTSIHYNMPYREPRFRNAMAHYSLFGKLSTTEVIDNVTGFGLFEKFFKESFETVNQALINELTKTRDSLEQYVTI